MTPPANRKPLSARRRQILDAIVEHQRAHGYPPSIREIAAEVGLKSPASVKAHIDVLGSAGYLRVDPTRPRAIEVRYDENSGAALERRPVRHVPLLGDVAAGSGVLAAENVEELVPMPADLTGEGELFMLRVRGDSMIDAGIHDGDYVVCRAQSTAENGEVIVAGIPGDEATVKTLRRRDGRIVLEPANELLQPMEFAPDEVTVYGKVVTMMRRY
ncbi:MAG: transcriptional repressor LexA [Acidimicrobiaceae bacterium]|nr:transcriptional repressor LexA [Acidimicrobiaceae bacterium]MYE75833.1 transcriptional repressor LexA [Acidimicrobiaceae bacterium]MYE97030.1 transcriptional repressor LexA [Acidimicrobiaceae bacterium]MYH43952.1 transcriptional repressor LexA [Acidimicrobiaceae bacterium]MYJ41069.1 transcriptional repressor LexA [Acidimicrobiaceae bacterium]